jgi:hypothetical protein
MKIAILMVVCEGEYAIACDALKSLVSTCAQHEIVAFIVDDASPSLVGERVVNAIERAIGIQGLCLRLPESLGYHGMAERLFIGLNFIVTGGLQFDLVIKLDPDVLVLRRDFEEFMMKHCASPTGLSGEMHWMHPRLRLSFLLDQLPVGFRRKAINRVMQHGGELSRVGPVWWSDIGRRAFLKGFRFRYVSGCFWVLGGETLRLLDAQGHLARSQERHGLLFNDDIILTTFVYALGHPVLDLSETSSHWGSSMFMSDQTPIEAVLKHAPYVVHPLKSHPSALLRRQELHRHYDRNSVTYDAAGAQQ